MTTRIEKDWVFNAGVHFDNKFIINNYQITLSMMVETESVREQNIAMERLEYFINEVIDSCIFIDKNKTKNIDYYIQAGIKVCLLPEEVYDQIIGMILLLKFNSILEKRLFVTDLTLSSKLSDNVRFHIVEEIATNLFDGDFWWNNNSTKLYDSPKLKDKKTKIVKLFDDEWTTVGLSWKDSKYTQSC